MQMAYLNRLCIIVSMIVMAAAVPSAGAQTRPTEWQLVQHLLRRFSFSAPPEEVQQVMAEGPMVWLNRQLNWRLIADNDSEVQSLPTVQCTTGDSESCDLGIYQSYMLQHWLLSPRQVQAKLELHWLALFSVDWVGANGNHIGLQALMGSYEAALRANALGNFNTLLANISAQPIMMYWLNNNGNIGSAPNVNFGREIMQLYGIGLYQLNDDGSQKLASDGTPIPNYTTADVYAVSAAMTGYSVVRDSKNPNPQTQYSVVFTAANHYSGSLTFLGAARTVPNDSTAINYVCNILAHHPSAAPFQVTQLLQRFVTETPSPKYISDVVAVWRQYVDAPDQLARVVRAIVVNPEFNAAYHGMPRQPAEVVMDAIRAIPTTLAADYARGQSYGATVASNIAHLGENLFSPSSVFSFYPPGHLGNLTNSLETITTQQVAGGFDINSEYTAGFDFPALLDKIGTDNGVVVTNYLLNALVDGGTPTLNAMVREIVGPTATTNSMQGAIWLIMSSHEYSVN